MFVLKMVGTLDVVLYLFFYQDLGKEVSQGPGSLVL